MFDVFELCYPLPTLLMAAVAAIGTEQFGAVNQVTHLFFLS